MRSRTLAGNTHCIAWAVGDNRNFWDPLHGYWPEGVPEEQTLTALENAYETMGFMRCSDGSLESEFEKVAIFTEDGTSDSKLLHAARQRYDGTWTSKLGSSFDITHYVVEGVEGPAYGKIASFMKKRKI